MQLLERDDELATLVGALTSAESRSGSVALVHSEPGLGKTALVDAFVRRIARRARVLEGACDDLVTPRVLGPLRDAAAGDGPLARSLRGEARRDAVFDALVAELDNPLTATVLVVEDVHWADEATLDALRFVGRRIAALPAVVVLTYRDADVPPTHPLRRVVGELPPSVVHRVPLRPLSKAAVGVLSGRPDEEVDALFDATAGNPFFVLEASRGGAGPGAVPPTIRDAVLARVAGLDQRSRHALGVLSVTPRRTERWLLEALLDGDLGAFDLPEQTGLVTSTPLYVGFVHGLARDAVLGQLPSSERIGHHRAIARLLVERGADPARVVHHAVGGGLSELVASEGPVAAREAAARGSHREALEHLLRIEEHVGALPASDQASVLESLAYELQLAGEQRRAVQVADRAVRLRERAGDQEQLANALLIASRARYWSEGQEAAQRQAERAVELVDHRSASPTEAMAYAHLARLHLLADRYSATVTWADRALEAAERAGHAPAAAGARVSRAAARLNRGELAAAEQLQVAGRDARRAGFHETAIRAAVHLATGLLRSGELVRAADVIAEGLEYARSQEITYGVERLEGLEAVVHLHRGRLDLTAASADAALGARTVRRQADALPISLQALAGVRAGDRDAVTLAQAAWDAARDSDEPERVGAAAVALAEVAWHLREPASCAEVAEVALPLLTSRSHDWFAGQLALGLARAGVPVEAPPRTAEGFAAALAGDHLAAAAWFEERGYAFEAAIERVWSGDESAMLDGLAWLDQVGAVGTANLVRAMLRDAGVRRVPRGPTRATRDNPAGLTPRQVEVLDLVVEGCTNADIADRLVLSVRTVDHHVSAILDKLGVSSRRDVGPRAAELGILTEA